MKLILVRHGESEVNAGNNASGLNKLTNKGKDQAKKAGKQLYEEKISAVFCSPTMRCEETMDEILNERNDSIYVSFTRLIGPKTKKETPEKMEKRLEMFLDDLKHEFPEGSVIIVSHNLPIRSMIKKITGEEVVVDNGEVTFLEYGL